MSVAAPTLWAASESERARERPVSRDMRTVVGYTEGFPEDLDQEKQKLTDWRGHAIEKWYVDEPNGEHTAFKRLTEDIAAGGIHVVVHRGIDFLPEDPHLLRRFYEAARETDTTLHAVEQLPPRAWQGFVAQLLPMLHQWARDEEEDSARLGSHVMYANAADIVWLRALLRHSKTPQARRWGRLLPRFEDEESIELPTVESLASIEIQNRRYAADRVSEIIDHAQDPDAAEILDVLTREADEAERTLRVAATAQEEADRDEYLAMWLRRRAEHFDDPSGDLGEFDRKARAIVLREEADLLDRKWKRLEGSAGE